MSETLLKKEKENSGKYERILNVALQLFKEKGYHGTSTAAIAKEANISKGLLYHYFSSKEDLIQHIGNKMYQLIYTDFDPNKDGVLTADEFELFVRSSFQSIRDNRDFFSMIFVISMNTEIRELMHQHCDVLSIQKQLVTLNAYFTQRFEKPEQALSLFMAHSKGAALLYCTETDYYTDEMFTFAEQDIIRRFKKG